MRIAIISDIHGNSVALDAVLSALQEEQVDRTVCLGDVATDGPQPSEVIANLRTLNTPVVMGNMDAWLLNPHPYPGNSRNARCGNEIRSWDVGRLSSSDLSYVHAFQTTIKMSLDKTVELLCYHGSPQSNVEGISSATSDEDLERLLSGCRTTLLAGGHTHTQMLRRHSGTTIINPGSVGAPPVQDGHDSRSAWAEYGVVCLESGNLGIEFRRIPVDLNLLIQSARESGMPHADWWLHSRYGLDDADLN